MDSILIAGSNGIIGSSLIKELHNSNIEFVGIGYEEINSKNYTAVDLTQKDSIKSFLVKTDKFNVLIFLTGLAHSKGKNKDYEEFYKVNFLTLKNLLEEMGVQNKLPDKIIFSSTISVYAERRDVEIYNETLEPQPQSPYAKTKLLSEKYLLANYSSISWILRFNPVYSKNFLLNIERRTRIRNRFFQFGDGKKKLTLLNIHNISQVIFEILNDKVKPGLYNLSDSTPYTYSDLLRFANAENILRVPLSVTQALYLAGKVTRNIFLKENSIKLGSDNVYTSLKLSQQIKLKHKLTDLKEDA